MRYFVQRRAKPVRAYDWDIPVGNAWNIPSVPDHEAADTGLVDENGDPIMRAPNPMGFVWGDAEGIETRRAATTGAVHESPVPTASAQDSPSPSHTREK